MIYKYTIIKLKHLVCTKLGETYREFIIVVSTTAYIHCYDRFNGVKVVSTHLGRVTHICVSKLTIIGSDNGLSPDRRQAITWTNAGILLIGPLGTNLSEILIEILTFSFKKMCLKVSSAKRRPFCLGLNELKEPWITNVTVLIFLKKSTVDISFQEIRFSKASKHFVICLEYILHQLGSYGEVIM